MNRCPHGRDLARGEPCDLCSRVTAGDWPCGLEPDPDPNDEEDDMRDLKQRREPLSLKDDVAGFGTIAALLLLALWLSGCQTPAARTALINLYDWNDDGCVTETGDAQARDAMFKARGGAGWNAWRVILGQCE